MNNDFDRNEFNLNSNRFLKNKIRDYLVNHPDNQLKGFNEPIWDEPLVGFADGDDIFFHDLKKIIGDFHLTPREALIAHLKTAACNYEQDLPNISVISWVLPSTRETRLGMREEVTVPSLRWNYTRWYGQDLNFKLQRYVVTLLEELGYHAVAPDISPFFERKNLPNGPASNWSLRHVAYAAGLGTFSLNDALITPKGIAVRLGSVVTNAKLQPSPRPYAHFRANCLFYRNGSCGKCMSRCPAGAITDSGHDKIKCREYLYGRQVELIKEMGREGYIGAYSGCGLCQTGTPCESGIPQQ